MSTTHTHRGFLQVNRHFRNIVEKYFGISTYSKDIFRESLNIIESRVQKLFPPCLVCSG